MNADREDRSESPKVSVVIVSWNTKDLLRNCLRSLCLESTGIAMEVIVLDNASTDGTAEMLGEEFPETVLIQSSENLGFAAGNNRAIAQTQGRFVFLLNPDTEVHPGCLEALSHHLDLNKDIAIVGPKILEPDGNVQVVCARNFPSLLASFFELSLLRRLFPHNRLFGRYRMEYWDHNDSRDIPCLLGAAMLIRRSFLERFGYLDDQIPMYYEDIEICKRAWVNGYRVHYLSEVSITHYVGKSASVSSQRLALFMLEQGESVWLYFRDYHGKLTAGAYSAIILGGSLFRTMLLTPPLAATYLFRMPARSHVLLAFRKYLSLTSWAVRDKRPDEVMKRFPLS